MPNGYCTNINTEEETIDHSQASFSEHAVSHLYSVPARSATCHSQNPQQNPQHTHAISSQPHSNMINANHLNQNHLNQSHSNQTQHIETHRHNHAPFQLLTFPENADLQNLPLDGRNFQVFSLSSDQLQSDATKAQIKSLLNLEPENELTPTEFQQNPNFHNEFQEFDNSTDFNQPIFETSANHEDSGTKKSLKMSQTIENHEETTQPSPPPPQAQQPLLVNAKQYHRILIRREQREKLIKLGRIPKHRKKYLHESRHRHAMMRNRSEGGRFNRGSTKTKLQALKNCEERRNLKEQKKKLQDENEVKNNSRNKAHDDQRDDQHDDQQNNQKNKLCSQLDSNDNLFSGENSSTIQ